MKSRVTKCAILAIALVAVASCGGSSSDESGSPTTLFQKNAAIIPTTTVASSGTLPSKGSAGGDTATTPATTPATTAAPATTLVAVPAAVAVTDPGNFQATYLASDNALGAPRPALPAEASLTSNAARAVSAAWNTDSVLTVTKAE